MSNRGGMGNIDFILVNYFRLCSQIEEMPEEDEVEEDIEADFDDSEMTTTTMAVDPSEMKEVRQNILDDPAVPPVQG